MEDDAVDIPLAADRPGPGIIDVDVAGDGFGVGGSGIKTVSQDSGATEEREGVCVSARGEEDIDVSGGGADARFCKVDGGGAAPLIESAADFGTGQGRVCAGAEISEGVADAGAAASGTIPALSKAGSQHRYFVTGA